MTGEWNRKACLFWEHPGTGNEGGYHGAEMYKDTDFKYKNPLSEDSHNGAGQNFFKAKFQSMKKSKPEAVFFNRRIFDNPSVIIRDGMDFNRALKIFKSKFQRSHILAILRERRNNPSRADRLREKRHKALKRLKKKVVK